MLSIKQLAYALAIAKTKHFKQAADLCNVSQSALSTGLAQLEERLGLQIFERDNKKVLITPMGVKVIGHIQQIMQQINALEHFVDSHKAPFSFPLTVGIIPTIAPYLLPVILPVLAQHYPQASLQVTENTSANLVAKVRNGELDTAILALPYPCEGLLTLEFWQEDFYWVSHQSALVNKQQKISSDHIATRQLMLLQEGHCLKDHILDVCKLSSATHGHGLEAASLHTLIQLVQGNLGTTLIPAMAKAQLLANNPDLVALHLDEPGPHRRLALVVRPNYSRFSSVQALSRLCEHALTHA